MTQTRFAVMAAQQTMDSVAPRGRTVRAIMHKGLVLYYAILGHTLVSGILNRTLKDATSVLDLGCGNYSSLRFLPGERWSIGVDLFRPYLLRSKRKGIHQECILADLRSVEFRTGSVDAAICISVMEHLTKADAYSLVEKMERWARKVAILYTTNGFYPQEAYDENPLQEHVSGWSSDDFQRLGYRVHGVGGWRRLSGIVMALERRFSSRGWSVLYNLSQLLVAESATESRYILCIKDLSSADPES